MRVSRLTAQAAVRRHEASADVSEENNADFTIRTGTEFTKIARSAVSRVIPLSIRATAVKPFPIFLVIRHQSEVCTLSSYGKF